MRYKQVKMLHISHGHLVCPHRESVMYRADFEKYIYLTYSSRHRQPWGIIEREGEGYLDLYTQRRWEGWKAAIQCTR